MTHEPPRPPADAIDTPAAVRHGEGLETEALLTYLQPLLPGLEPPLVVRQFPCGFSNLTYLVRGGERQWVLRRPPFGASIRSAHDMGREFHLLERLHPVYAKVPRPLVHCTDESVIGAEFYLMERVEGVILRAPLTAEAAPEPKLMAAIGRSFVDTLVELHAVDFEAAGLGDLGRPEGYVRRQIEGWTRRWEKARTDEVPELERAASWLASRLPAEGRPALLHNDFKYDNLVLDRDDLSRVVAVLDWEMATLGDPLMDLGTTLGYWVDADDPPALRGLNLSPTTVAGNPSRSEVAERYARRSGRDLGDPVFYYAYGLFKIAVIIQQIYHRYRQGHTQDPRFANLLDGVRLCGRMAAQAIDRKRIDRLFG